MENPKWTISDRVYEGLRASIMSLKLKPGDEIRIKGISENLGVSRSPVRDALLKLEKDGLVDLMPQKGTFVSRIDLSRMREEHFLRESLEEKTLELFLGRHAESDLLRLGESLAKQQACLATGDYAKFLELDDEFHRVFFDAADKPLCWAVIRNMSGHYRRVRLLVLRNAEVPASIYAQHMDLFECIRKDDRKNAMTIMQRHLSKLNSEEKGLLAEFPDYFTSRNSGDMIFQGEFL